MNQKYFFLSNIVKETNVSVSLPAYEGPGPLKKKKKKKKKMLFREPFPK